MKKKKLICKITSLLFSLALILTMTGFRTAPVHAENLGFITDISLAVGQDGYDKMEKDGYNVRGVGLNVTADEDAQVYVGYKLGENDPVTGVIVAAGQGDTIDVDGITYTCAAKVDVDAVDLGDTAWAFNNDKKGVYFFWDADADAFIDDTTASTFTGGQLALAGGLGLIIGALGGTLVLRTRRKKEEDQPA